jgi:hypothetical protein
MLQCDAMFTRRRLNICIFLFVCSVFTLLFFEMSSGLVFCAFFKHFFFDLTATNLIRFKCFNTLNNDFQFNMYSTFDELHPISKFRS